jgi:hypothetical protein
VFGVQRSGKEVFRVQEEKGSGKQEFSIQQPNT